MQCQVAQECWVHLFAYQLQTFQVNVGDVGMKMRFDVLLGKSGGTIQV